MYIIVAAAFVVFLYWLQLQIYSKKWSENLKADAYFGVSEVFEGEGADLTETLENAKWLPLPMVKMKLQLSRKLLFRDRDNSVVSDYFYRTDIYSIWPNQKVTRSMKFICSKRGYYDFRGIDLVGSNLFFTKEYVESVDTTSHLYVFPKLYNPEIMEPIFNKINGDVLTKRNLVEDPFELRGIREYQPYDGMKNINWKASAKTDDLMVNVHDYTTHRTIRVFVDFEKPKVMTREEILELCISMAAANVAKYAQNGVLVSIYANSHDILTDKPLIMDPGCGENFLRGVNRALARIDLSKNAYSFRKLYGELVTDEADDSYSVIYSANMQDDFQKLLLEMVDRKKDFCWICPKYAEDDFEVDENLREYCLMVKAEEALYEISNS